MDHEYVTEGPFRDFAHAVVNLQTKASEGYFKAMVRRVAEYTRQRQSGSGESNGSNNDDSNSNSNSNSNDSIDDEASARVVELIVIAASCAGVRAHYATLGEDPPPLPDRLVPNQPALFNAVSDYATGPLQYNKTNAWGPFNLKLRKGIAEQLELEPLQWWFATKNDGGPNSKATVGLFVLAQLIGWRNVFFYFFFELTLAL